MLSRPEYEREVVEVYRPRAGDYEAYAAGIQGYYGTAQDFLRRHASSGKRVLDVGCGPGQLTKDLAADVAVSGLDLSPEMIALAREGRPAGEWHCRSFHDDFDDLGTFDAVLATSCFEFCLDLPGVVSRLARAAVPGGAVLLGVPERWPAGPGAARGTFAVPTGRAPIDIHLFSETELRAATAAAGLAWVKGRRLRGWTTAHGVEIPYLMAELRRPDRP